MCKTDTIRSETSAAAEVNFCSQTTAPIRNGVLVGGGALQDVVACCFVELINLTCNITPVKFQSLLDVLFQPASRCTGHLTNESALHVPRWRKVRGNSMRVTMCDLHNVSVL